MNLKHMKSYPISFTSLLLRIINIKIYFCKSIVKKIFAYNKPMILYEENFYEWLFGIFSNSFFFFKQL